MGFNSGFKWLMSQQNAVSHKVAGVHGGVIMRDCCIIAENGTDDDYCDYNLLPPSLQ
jgi:hypothetical protein